MVKYLNVKLLFNKREILRNLNNYIENNSAEYICAVNANSMVIANEDVVFLKSVNEAGFNLCDGTMVALSYKMIYKKTVDSYPGPDFFIDILNKKKYRSFFFGSTEQVLSNLKSKLTSIDPRINDMIFYSPPFLPLDEYDYESIADMINKDDPDIIWVSLGAPKQEVFMNKLKPYLKKGVMVGVGAAFDFYGNDNLKRAPHWIRKIKLEWLYRVSKNPSKSLPRLIKQIKGMPKLLIEEIKIKKSKRCKN